MKKQADYDPSPYDGPIERADGVRPYNHYLWPTESWWANQELHQGYDSRWHFGIVALADGRFATEGQVRSIEKNNYGGRKIVFATRTEAIRVAAARMIRQARFSRKWTGLFCGGVKGEKLAGLINWTLGVVAKETGSPAPRPVCIKEIKEPQPRSKFPLFDFADSRREHV
jgi:hypothetical protein